MQPYPVTYPSTHRMTGQILRLFFPNLRQDDGVLMTLVEDMADRKGMSWDNARSTLLSAEPFQNYPALVAALPLAGSPSNAT